MSADGCSVQVGGRDWVVRPLPPPSVPLRVSGIAAGVLQPVPLIISCHFQLAADCAGRAGQAHWRPAGVGRHPQGLHQGVLIRMLLQSLLCRRHGL